MLFNIFSCDDTLQFGLCQIGEHEKSNGIDNLITSSPYYYPFCRLKLVLEKFGQCKSVPTNQDLIKGSEFNAYKLYQGPQDRI